MGKFTRIHLVVPTPAEELLSMQTLHSDDAKEMLNCEVGKLLESDSTVMVQIILESVSGHISHLALTCMENATKGVLDLELLQLAVAIAIVVHQELEGSAANLLGQGSVGELEAAWDRGNQRSGPNGLAIWTRMLLFVIFLAIYLF